MIEGQLKEILEKTFTPTHLVIENQSHFHSSHASSPQTGESHFRIFIVSDAFRGMSLVERHRVIHTAVDSLFSKGLHALSIKAGDTYTYS